MHKAIFWDRDGVINRVLDRGAFKNVGPHEFEDFKLADNIGKILEQTKLAGYLNILATNQPDVGRSLISWEELNKMHDFLKANAPALDAVYVCPHDDKDNCHCRKPKPGLLLDAAKDYKINLAQSYMVGDKQKDIDAAKNAGVKSVLLQTRYNSDVTGYIFGVKSLEEIIKIIN